MVYKADIKSYLLELILETTNAPFFAIDRNNSIVSWNCSLTELTGISSDWALGRSFPDSFLSPDGAVAWAKEIEGINADSIQLKNEWKIPGRAPLSLTSTFAAAPLDSSAAGYLVGTVREAENSRTGPDLS